MMIKLPKYEEVSVLVVGDLMLDRYWEGPTERISPEAPVPVVHVKTIEERPGGAANVARNLRNLGCQVTLIGIVGKDEAGQVLIDCLEKEGIHCRLLKVEDLPTITKLRVLGKNQQLIRLDFEESFHALSKAELLTDFNAALPLADIVIFSDYNKGALSSIREMIAFARNANIPTFVDPKQKDFSCYRGATIITPNLKEFQEVVGSFSDEKDLVNKAQLLIHEHQLQALLVTRGDEGMSLVLPDGSSVNLKAHASEVYDVSGAGDTVISVLAASFAAGQDFEIASKIANIAAGIVVKKSGVATVSVPELRRAIQRQCSSYSGIFEENELLLAVEDAKAHHERVVMTNGCFDLLHAGHIAYLEQAKQLGDRLIVAVNDDASVKRLKNEARPINKLEDRMAVLSALRCVDWVVSFTEDTPRRIISRINPDVLVKGADYEISQIAGSEEVLKNGGQVLTLPFVPGYSTTRTLTRIKEE